MATVTLVLINNPFWLDPRLWLSFIAAAEEEQRCSAVWVPRQHNDLLEDSALPDTIPGYLQWQLHGRPPHTDGGCFPLASQFELDHSPPVLHVQLWLPADGNRGRVREKQSRMERQVKDKFNFIGMYERTCDIKRLLC